MKDFKVNISIPAISNMLFDKDVKKPESPPEPDNRPEVEAINQEFRAKHREEHPTIKEFIEGFHEGGVGYNPNGVFCGECASGTCRGCINEHRQKSDTDE